MNLPKYIKIRDELLAGIRSGKLKPGDRLPTREELVDRFGVTRTTIDKALAELRRRHAVQASRRAGTVVTQGIDPVRVGIISKMSFPPEDDVIGDRASTIRGMFGSIVLHGSHLDIKYLDETAVLGKPDLVRTYDVLVWVQPNNHVLEKLTAMDSNIIITNRYSRRAHFVSTNHRAAIREITSHFIQKCGSQSQLFYLGSKSDEFVFQERREGFVEACEEYGRFYRISTMSGNFNENLTLLNAIEFKPHRPVIMVSPSISFTGAVLKMAAQKGFVYSRNFFYTDFDNDSSIQNYGFQVTTVLQDYQQMGIELIQAIESISQGLIQKFVPHKIVLGPGCEGSLPTANPKIKTRKSYS